MSNADRSIWQFPKNVANKVPGWRSDGKGLENKGPFQVLPDVRDYGATVDGSVSDRTAMEDMLTAVDYAKLAPGTSLLETNVSLSSDQSVTGQIGVTKVLGDNDLGSGGSVFSVAADATGTFFSGIDLEIPLTTNALRGIRIGTATDVVIDGLRSNTLTAGTYTVAALTGNMERVTLGNFDIKGEDYGLLWKPNISDPTSNTFQGKDLLVYGGRFTGQGTRGGKIAVSLDGNHENSLIVGVQAVNVQDTVGSEGFAFGMANDGALPTKARGAVLTGVGSRDTQREAVHLEDALNGIVISAASFMDAERGARIITNATGYIRQAHFSGIFVDNTGLEGWSIVSDSVTDGAEQINLHGLLINKYGQDTDSAAIQIHGDGGNKININSCHIRNGNGDGISVDSDGINPTTGAAGGIVISQNTLENVVGYAMDITSAATAGRIHIKSDNSFSDTSLGLFSAGSSLTNVSADQRTRSNNITAGATQQDQPMFHARRDGQIVRLDCIYMDANNSTVANFVQLRKRSAAGVDSQMGSSFSIGIASDAAMSTRNLGVTIDGGAFDAGDTIYVRKTTAGDGTGRFAIQAEYFEYF